MQDCFSGFFEQVSSGKKKKKFFRSYKYQKDFNAASVTSELNSPVITIFSKFVE